MLFSIVKHPNISANDLNHELDIINRWPHQWKLEFNPDPLKQATEVLFFCKNNAHNQPQIIFNGTVVAKVEEQKHLGLTLKSKLSFEKTSEWKIIKAKKNIDIIKHLSRFFPLKILDQIYKALVRPHLDYCDVIYHTPPKQDKFSVVLNSLMETVEKSPISSSTGCYWCMERFKSFQIIRRIGLGVLIRSSLV